VDLPIGLPCPRCHRTLEPPGDHGVALQRVGVALTLVVCLAVVPSFLMLGDGSWVDQCMDLARTALSH
jgi:hypothetical protein